MQDGNNVISIKRIYPATDSSNCMHSIIAQTLINDKYHKKNSFPLYTAKQHEMANAKALTIRLKIDML